MVLTGRASFAQERLYFLNELQPGNPAYVVAFALRLDGLLRTDALVAALETVVARHDALRTTFRVVDGVLEQRVRTDPERAADAEITVETAPWVDRAGQDAQLRDLIATEAATPFALDRGPLLRAWVRSWSDEEHALAVLVHHIACDGWSVGLVLADLAAEYNAAAAGTVATYAAEPQSYLRYAVAQRAECDGSEAGLAFWRDTLANAPELALPTDLPRPSVLSCRGAVVRRPVTAELVERLTHWARARGTDAVHRRARGVRHGALPIHRSGRRGGRRAGREPDGGGRGDARRLPGQHATGTGRPVAGTLCSPSW